MFRYGFPAVVVVWSALIEFCWLGFGFATEALACDRSPAHHHAPGRPSTNSVCSNRLYMFYDLRFVSGYAFAVVVVVVRYDFRGGRRVGCAWRFARSLCRCCSEEFVKSTLSGKERTISPMLFLSQCLLTYTEGCW
jgi:hypothetical protein